MSRILDRLYNLHWVADGVARSAQPYLGFYSVFLRAHGFRSLINLRGHNPRFSWWRREKEICGRLGIAHFDVKLSSRKLPPREVVVPLFEAFAGAVKPILLKCSGGQDRTSFAAALYVLHEQGAGALKEAGAQFAAWPYLHLPVSRQNWLRQFPVFAIEDALGAPLKDWAATRYSPEAFASWLEARGLGASHAGIQRLKRRAHEA
ncbi:MAG: hypothetical protein ACT4OG_09150 [Alphaproteobacteria bacterium]